MTRGDDRASWFGYDDVDLGVVEQDGALVAYGDIGRSRTRPKAWFDVRERPEHPGAAEPLSAGARGPRAARARPPRDRRRPATSRFRGQLARRGYRPSRLVVPHADRARRRRRAAGCPDGHRGCGRFAAAARSGGPTRRTSRAFADHWEFQPDPFERWRRYARRVERASTRRSASLAEDGRRARGRRDLPAGTTPATRGTAGSGSSACGRRPGAARARPRAAAHVVRRVRAARLRPGRPRRRRREHDRRGRGSTSAPACGRSVRSDTLGAPAVSRLRAQVPDCRTLTAVALGAGLPSATLRARVRRRARPRSARLGRRRRGDGGGGGASRCRTRRPASSRRRRSRSRRSRSPRAARRGRSSSAAAAARTSARSRGSPRATAGSPSSGSTRTAT